MPLRSPKMYSFIFGFQRRTWWPKCTPASNNSFILTVTKQLSPLCQLVCVLAATVASALKATNQNRDNGISISNFEMRIADWRNKSSLNSKSAIRNSQFSSSLRELEALARALLSVLLAFLDPRIARDQSRVFQRRPQVAVVLNQSSRNSVTNRSGLARWSAAGNVDQHVELGCRLSQLHRLTNDHPQRLVRKIHIGRSAINLTVAGAGS